MHITEKNNLPDVAKAFTVRVLRQMDTGEAKPLTVTILAATESAAEEKAIDYAERLGGCTSCEVAETTLVPNSTSARHDLGQGSFYGKKDSRKRKKESFQTYQVKVQEEDVVVVYKTNAVDEEDAKAQISKRYYPTERDQLRIFGITAEPTNEPMLVSSATPVESFRRRKREESELKYYFVLLKIKDLDGYWEYEIHESMGYNETDAGESAREKRANRPFTWDVSVKAVRFADDTNLPASDLDLSFFGIPDA